MNVAETASLRPVKSLENFRILSASVFLNLRMVCYNHSRINTLLGQLTSAEWHHSPIFCLCLQNNGDSCVLDHLAGHIKVSLKNVRGKASLLG